MGAVLTPDVGSPILSTDPIVFDVTDASEVLTDLLITVRHDTGVIELAHNGSAFTSFFASGSTRTVITNGYHFSIVRAGGWADTKVVVSAYPFAGSGGSLINFSSDFGVLSDPPGEDVSLSVTGATAGSFGSASRVATFTVDSKGRLTASGQTSIILTDNSSSAIAHVGSGGATSTNAANIGDVTTAVAAEATARGTAVTAEATARAAAVTAEAVARAAADALIPGTITALTGDVTAAGTGSVASTLANLPQAVLLTRLAALTADAAFNTHKLTGIGNGTNPQDAAAFHQIADAVTTAVSAEATTRAAADAAEAAARAAADLLIPGTITALTGDVTAAGTGSVASTLANLPQAVLLARLAALTADAAFNTHKLTGIGDGTNPQDAAAFHQISDAVAVAAFTVANAAALVAVSAGDGAFRYVQTYRDVWRLDKSGTTRTVVTHQVIQSTVNAAWYWIRLNLPEPFWQAQTNWYIDPAGTASTPGDDEASGLTSGAPIKSIAEWRRRIRGSVYQGVIVINALSGSTVLDDGLLTGFTTLGSAANVCILGTTTVVFSGTVGAGSVGYSGNVRGQIVDAGIASSWTASGGVSTTAASRFIRQTGGGWMAPLLKDMGSKTVMIGLPVTASETDTAAFQFPTQVPTVGDTYQVVSRPVWPPLYPAGTKTRMQCLDIKHPTGGTIGSTTYSTRDQYVLCGFLTQANFGVGFQACYVCVAVSAVSSTGGFSPTSCAFLNSIVQLGDLTNWNPATNVFVAAEFRVWHGGNLGSSGNILAFDTSFALVGVRHGSEVNIETLAGSGNTGPLVLCGGSTAGAEGLNRVTGAAFITATTSASLPYQVCGVNYAAPVNDAGSGSAIYMGGA